MALDEKDLQLMEEMVSRIVKTETTILRVDLTNDFAEKNALLRSDLTNDFAEKNALLRSDLTNDFAEKNALLRSDLTNDFAEKNALLRSDLMGAIKQTVADETILIVDRLEAKITASENRLETKIVASENRLMTEIRATENRLSEQFAEVVGESLVPQIDDHETRIIKLETKIA